MMSKMLSLLTSATVGDEMRKAGQSARAVVRSSAGNSHPPGMLIWTSAGQTTGLVS